MLATLMGRRELEPNTDNKEEPTELSELVDSELTAELATDVDALPSIGGL